jgi:hypothetical protein
VLFQPKPQIVGYTLIKSFSFAQALKNVDIDHLALIRRRAASGLLHLASGASSPKFEMLKT